VHRHEHQVGDHQPADPDRKRRQQGEKHGEHSVGRAHHLLDLHRGKQVEIVLLARAYRVPAPEEVADFELGGLQVRAGGEQQLGPHDVVHVPHPSHQGGDGNDDLVVEVDPVRIDPHVGQHPDHLERHRVDPDLLADRVASLEQVARHHGSDERHPRGARDIGRGEVGAPGYRAIPHHLRRLRVPFDPDSAGAAAVHDLPLAGRLNRVGEGHLGEGAVDGANVLDFERRRGSPVRAGTHLPAAGPHEHRRAAEHGFEAAEHFPLGTAADRQQHRQGGDADEGAEHHEKGAGLVAGDAAQAVLEQAKGSHRAAASWSRTAESATIRPSTMERIRSA